MALTEDDLRRIAEYQVELQRQQGRNTFSPGGSSGGAPSADAARAASDAANAFGGALQNGGMRVSDFSDAITSVIDPTNMFSGALAGAISYIEETNDAFRVLSRVGGGLNGDLGELRLGVASSRMRFEDYTNMISRNAGEMNLFAGGVNGGIRAFRRLTDDMFAEDGVITGFMNLGYTLEESNEFLLDNMKLMSRQARLEGMDARQQTEAALRLAESMDAMAKLTGEQVEDQRDRLVEAQRDGATQARLRLLEKQGIQGVQEGFNTAYTELAAGGPQLQQLFQDYVQAGAPLSDATRQYAAMNQEAAALARQAAAVNASNLPAEEKRRRVQELAQRAAAAGLRSADSVTNLTVATYGQINDVARTQANVLESTGPLIDQLREYAASQGEVLGQTITYQQAYRDYMASLSAETRAQAGGSGDDQGASVAINEGQLAIANAASRINENIAQQIQSNNVLVSAYDRVGNVIQGAADFIANATNNAINALPGASREEGMADAQGGGVITPEDADRIRAAQTLDGFTDAVSNATREGLIDGLGPVLDQDLLRVGIVRIDQGAINSAYAEGASPDPAITPDGGIVSDFWRSIFGGERAIGGPVQQGKFYTVGEEGPETLVSTGNGFIIPNMDSAIEQVRTSLVQTVQQNNLIPNLRNIAQRMQQTGPQAIMNNPQELINQMRSELVNNRPDISTQRMEQLLDTLNQGMLQLVSINNNMSRNGARTVEALRGASGNLLQGVRAR
jgi:hypothetical protein